jgi:TolA-binding protein
VTPDDRDDAGLGPRAAALTALARKGLGQMAPAEHARGRQRLRVRLARRRQRIAWSLALAGAGVAAFAGGLVVPRFLHRGDNAPLAYEVEGGSLASDGLIEAPSDAAPALRFADGTVIALERGTKGRLASVDGRGAHLAISDGSASVSVVPKPHARWRVDAGPFVIHVHGTVFTAAWNESSGRLDVKLERGSISVEGPVTGGPIAMRAGQRLTVAMRQSRVLLRAIDDRGGDEALGSDTTVAATPVAEVAPPPVLAEPAPAAAASAQPLTKANARPIAVHAAARSWSAALAAGDFASIVEEAGRDLPRALHTASSDDLAALADAARYRRRDDLARMALETQRHRFHGSQRAADAAFFLGRLDENDGAGLVHALRWYDRYLDEAPTGSYAAEALGRKMVAMRDLYGEATARGVADEYVRRFPHGSYAGAARALRDQTHE